MGWRASDDTALIDLLRSWGKFPAQDEADFACLVNEVRTALQEGADVPTIAMVIQNEFYNHTGAVGPHDDILSVARAVSSLQNDSAD
jgi:hypothetical protein